MQQVVLLDANPLSQVTHPKIKPLVRNWMQYLREHNIALKAPEISVYEVRRELIRLDNNTGLTQLAQNSGRGCDTGTLNIDPTSGRREWVDQSRPSDKNIKGVNQVLPRIAALFPKATKTTQYDPVSKRNVQILRGIGFVENTRTTVENFRTNYAPVAAPEIDTQQAERTTRTSFGKVESEKNIEEEKNKNEKNIESGNQSPPQSGAGDAETKHSKDSDCGSGAGSGADNVNNGAGNVNKGSKNLSEQIKQTWNDKSALGKLILSIADTIELDAFVVTLTNEEIKYIKSAAKLTWRPGCDSFGEYRGEKCELIEFGTNMRTWKVRPVSGTSQIKVSVFDVALWLGI